MSPGHALYAVIITSAMAKVMFSSLSVACLSVCPSVRPFVCVSVCLSVCLSLSNIREKRLNWFSWTFQSRWDLIQGTIGNIFRMFRLTPWTKDLFPTFSEQSTPLNSIAEKTVKQIFMKFSEKDGHDTGSNLEHFRDVTVNPFNPGSIYLFPGSVFVSNIMENGWTAFHEFFMKRQAWHKK